MKKFLIIFSVLILTALGGFFVFREKEIPSENQMSKTAPQFEEKIRMPAVAGQFYPGEKEELGSMIEEYLSQAQPVEIEGEIFGLVLPHAGYVFSGPVAAAGIKAVAGKSFDTVIIMGDSHMEHFDGVSIWPAGAWETPLGKIEVDSALAEAILAESERFFSRDSAHLFEHSLEVQLPFLQKTLKDFKILPIIFGSEDKDWAELARVILRKIKNKKVLIIASSDLSHYPPYDLARKEDSKTLEAILNLDFQTLDRELTSNVQTYLCGKDSVKTLMEMAKNLGAKAKLLKYANSGDAPVGDRAKVVGYGAVVFYRGWKEELLDIAKASVESFVREGKIPEFKVNSEKLKQKQGAFVTLKKQGQLRGCIGHMAEDTPLYQVVSQMAVAAAVEDRRFPPVTASELPELEYEISILSPFKLVNSPDEIQVGLHGVQVIAGKKSGVFLPQVATENNWDLETFLNHLMLKAGLWPGYWRENPVDFYVFTAQVFGSESISEF